MDNPDFCKDFTGGWCPRSKSHIPREWCYRRCNYGKSYPSIVKMARQFVAASAKQAIAGMPKRSEDEIKRIKAICESCDELNNEDRRCYACGCKMDVKMTWATTKCKLGKW